MMRKQTTIFGFSKEQNVVHEAYQRINAAKLKAVSAYQEEGLSNSYFSLAKSDYEC